MKIKIYKITVILVFVFLIIFTDYRLLNGGASISGFNSDFSGEKITYVLSAFGKAEYNDFGIVDLKGKKANLVTFRTEALSFEDTEKIYSDPESLLPYKVERNISALWGKEYITEEYDQKKFTVTIRKFKNSKLVSQQIVNSDGPIHNSILIPFYPRKCHDLAIGWRFTVRVPNEFRVELVSIDEIIVPAGKFQAYHFKSTPDKFEIWIGKNNPRIPLKIKGKGFLDYELSMKERSILQ